MCTPDDRPATPQLKCAASDRSPESTAPVTTSTRARADASETPDSHLTTAEGVMAVEAPRPPARNTAWGGWAMAAASVVGLIAVLSLLWPWLIGPLSQTPFSAKPEPFSELYLASQDALPHTYRGGSTIDLPVTVGNSEGSQVTYAYIIRVRGEGSGADPETERARGTLTVASGQSGNVTVPVSLRGYEGPIQVRISVEFVQPDTRQPKALEVTLRLVEDPRQGP